MTSTAISVAYSKTTDQDSYGASIGSVPRHSHPRQYRFRPARLFSGSGIFRNMEQAYAIGPVGLVGFPNSLDPNVSSIMSTSDTEAKLTGHVLSMSIRNVK